MDDQQPNLSKTRSLSMPVINSEDAIIKKVQEQEGIITLMQTQIEFQTEVISKHDKMFQDVLTKMQDLTSKVKILEDLISKEKESADRDAKKSALWGASTTGGSESISIADMVKETAEQTLGAESGYVYDENLGLYYDQSSGYYYDPVKQLFYNGHTKTYYSYDATSNTYQIQPTDSAKRKKSGKSKSKKATKQQRISESDLSKVTVAGNGERDPKPDQIDVNEETPSPTTEEAVTSYVNESSTSTSPASPEKPPSDMEEGELDSSAPTSAESSPAVSGESKSSDDEHENGSILPVNYPPCIRAVVQSGSESSGFKTGTLFLIPCTGGTIGSSGKAHTVLLPSPSIDKMHAKIYFQNEQAEDQASKEVTTAGKYFIMDLGSKEGTYLNRTRVSEPGVQSDPFELVHGSTLQVGDVTLLIHIHPGDFTCGHCEPGLIIQKDPMYEYTGEDAESVRRSEIKKMKKKYGLDRKNETVKTFPSGPTPSYTDRAKTRRQKVGSDNPFAKTEVASAETPIRESNVGFKMMKKMGWKGEGLGNPQSTGIIEPIKCDVKNDRGGLGLEGPALLSAASTMKKGKVPNKSQQKSENLSKTIERFQKNPDTENTSKVTEDFDY